MNSLLSFFGRLNGSQRVLLIGVVGVFLFLVWASLAQVDEITRGQGRVIPSSKVQVVQASDPSTVSDILVRSGERVKKGQLLVRLDDTDSSSALGQIEAENRSLSARAARLEREGRGTSTDCPPGAPCAEEAALQRARQAALRSKQTGLAAAIEQRRRDQSEAQATVASLQSSVDLARRQVNMLQPLAAKSIVPQTELMTAQRELVDLQGRLAAARQGVSRAAASIREAQAQYSEADLQFRQEALSERSQVSAKIAVNKESIRGAQGRLERFEIRSPVDGIVNDVQITTIGGFVGPGEKIMQVVPIGDKLLIEARVRPSDIAFIRVNDRANVKVTAYDFSIYGGLEGNVVQISADSIYDEAKQEAYFTVIVETDQAWLQSAGKKLPITPGMICDVEILTGRKSILSYLLKPVLRARSQALTER